MRLRLCAPSRVKESFRAFAIELRAPVDQILNGGGAFFDQRVDGVLVAESVARVERVLLVQRDLIVVAERHGDAALRVFGRGLAQGVFGDHENAAGLRQFDCRAQTGDAGANDQKVAVHRHCDSNNAGLRGMFGHGVGLSGRFEKNKPISEMITAKFGFCGTNPSRVDRGQKNELKIPLVPDRCVRRRLAQGMFGPPRERCPISRLNRGTRTGDGGANNQKAAVHRHCDPSNVC